MRIKHGKVLVIFTVNDSIVIVPKNTGLKKYRDIALSCLNVDNAKIIEARGEDIPFLIAEMQEKGKKAIGLTGQDLYKEFCIGNKDNCIKVIKRIEWNEKDALFSKPALCLIGPKDKKIDELGKNLTVFISSKYKNISKKYLNFLEQKGFNFKKRYINGCVETSCSEGIADLIIDIVYTGSSLRRYGLEIYDKIMESDFVIISNDVGIKVKDEIKNIAAYKAPLEDRNNKLKLDFNENTQGCSKRIVEVLSSINEEYIATYPEYSKFKQKLAMYLDVNSKNIILTNGTDEAIKLIMDCYVEKGDEAVIPEPTFPLFNFYSQIAGAKIIRIKYAEKLIFPVEKVIEAINEKTKIVVIVNPNNPTGTVVCEEDIVRIVKKALLNNAIVVVDEAYWQFYGKSCKKLTERYNNLAVIQTFSKAFGLAGLRLGYIIANDKRIMEINKVCSPYSVNSIAVAAASAALEDTRYVDEYVKEVTENRKYMSNMLNMTGIRTYESEANFILADFGDRCYEVFDKLRMKGILVRDKSDEIQGCLRITIGTREQCDRLLNSVKEIIRDKAILFDMDGVLVDTCRSYDNAILRTTSFFGKEISYEEIKNFRERGFNNDWDLTEAVLFENGISADKNEVINKFQEYYSQVSDNEKLLVSKMLLARLSKRYLLGIVTGRPRKEAEAALQRFGIRRFFSAVVTMDDCNGILKPNPYGIELALKKLGRKDAIYFGDNVDDVKAATSAGIKVVGISKDNKIKSIMMENGATKILEDVNCIMGAV